MVLTRINNAPPMYRLDEATEDPDNDIGDPNDFPLGTTVIMASEGSWDVIMTNENGPHIWRHISSS
jgi:hypothetical protein